MPARLRVLIKALGEQGVAVEKPKTGSHWKAKRDGKVYPIPAHNGPRTDIPDVYINGVGRCFALDMDALWRSIRNED